MATLFESALRSIYTSCPHRPLNAHRFKYILYTRFVIDEIDHQPLLEKSLSNLSIISLRRLFAFKMFGFTGVSDRQSSSLRSIRYALWNRKYLSSYENSQWVDHRSTPTWYLFNKKYIKISIYRWKTYYYSCT